LIFHKSFYILFTMARVHLAIVVLLLSGCNALLPPLRRSTTIQTTSINSLGILPKTALFQQQQANANPEQQQQQQPLLARAYSKALRVAIRFGTLFGTIDGLDVSCKAESNRNVVTGKISSIQIDVDRISSPFLKTNDFQLVGTDLELGFGPLLLLLTPFLLVSTRQVLSLMLCLILGPRLLKTKPKPISVATYRLGLTGEDLSAPNTLLRMILHRSMDHLLRNSVVGTILAGSAAAKVPNTQQEQMSELTSALDENSTKLEMNRVSVGDNGRLILDAVANFPDPSSGTRSRLDFVVRLSLSPLDDDLMRIAAAAATAGQTAGSNTAVNAQQQQQQLQQPDGCGIMVTNAELKASFNRDTMGVPLEIFGKPIPDLWIPVVSGGLAYSFGRRHRVVSIESDPSRDRLDICGALYFNGDAPVLKKNAFGIWKSPFSGPALPPPKQPKRPALPSSHQ
jgi:hypothetical protein